MQSSVLSSRDNRSEIGVHHGVSVSSNYPRFSPAGPGIELRRTRGAKNYSWFGIFDFQPIWYTLDQGGGTKIYHRPANSQQIRDLQFPGAWVQ